VTRPVDGAGATRLAAAPPTRRSRWWPWLAVAALLLGVAGGGFAGYRLFGASPPEAVTLTYGDGGEVPELEVSGVYPCTIISPAPGKGVESNSSVDCDKRHEAEQFAEVTLYASNEVFGYPGEQQLRALGASTCRFYFDSPLVVAPDKSRLEVVALVPTEARFQKDSSTSPGYHTFNGRMLYCMLRAVDGSQLESSLVAPQPT
jgi:hypothetical protein